MRRKRERRSGADRRSGEERRWSGADDPRDLYQSDLDRHLWSWPTPSRRKRKRKGRFKRVGLIASAAGLIGAAGYLFYRRRQDDAAANADPEDAQGSED